MRLDLVFLVGTSTSGGVFCGVCGLIMILGSLSFCLTYCVSGLLFSDCMFVVPVVFGVCSQRVRLVQ